MEKADAAIVYFNPHVFELKKMQILNKEDIKNAFGGKTEVINQTEELISKISNLKSNVSGQPCVLLLMSSGNFDNAALW